MDTIATMDARPLGILEKIRVLAAVAVAVALMVMVGWMVARPVDPEMAISFTVSGRSLWAVWPALLALTVVAGLVGTVVAGPRLPEAGAFAAAVGLAAMLLRGGSMQDVLGYYAGAEASTRAALMLRLGVESVVWGLLLLLACVAVRLVVGWLWPERMLAVSTVSLGSAGRSSPGVWSAWPGLVVTAVIALFVIWTVVAREPWASVSRGQVIAAVAGGLYLGAMAARYFTGVEDPRGCMAAPLVVAVVAYLLGYLQADLSWAAKQGVASYAHLATTPPHALVRVLPAEYIAVGLAGAIAGYWSGARIEQAAEAEDDG